MANFPPNKDFKHWQSISNNPMMHGWQKWLETEMSCDHSLSLYIYTHSLYAGYMCVILFSSFSSRGY